MPPSFSRKKREEPANVRVWGSKAYSYAITIPKLCWGEIYGKYMRCVGGRGVLSARSSWSVLKGGERKHAEKHTCRRCGRNNFVSMFLYELRYCWSEQLTYSNMFLVPPTMYIHLIIFLPWVRASNSPLVNTVAVRGGGDHTWARGGDGGGCMWSNRI